jgi:hypothetical protein
MTTEQVVLETLSVLSGCPVAHVARCLETTHRQWCCSPKWGKELSEIEETFLREQLAAGAWGNMNWMR